jgi:hypothetical protein
MTHTPRALDLKRWRLLLAAGLLVLTLATAGAVSSASAQTTRGATAHVLTAHTVAKTAAFVLHMGLAFGAFHHFIYEPLAAGDFKHPFLHKLTLLKSALAAVFVYHELEVAFTDAQGSTLLQKLLSPINVLVAKVKALASSLKGSSPSAASVTQAQGLLSSVGTLAKGAGATITPTIPTSLTSF